MRASWWERRFCPARRPPARVGTPPGMRRAPWVWCQIKQGQARGEGGQGARTFWMIACALAGSPLMRSWIIFTARSTLSVRPLTVMTRGWSGGKFCGGGQGANRDHTHDANQLSSARRLGDAGARASRGGSARAAGRRVPGCVSPWGGGRKEGKGEEGTRRTWSMWMCAPVPFCRPRMVSPPRPMMRPTMPGGHWITRDTYAPHAANTITSPRWSPV